MLRNWRTLLRNNSFSKCLKQKNSTDVNRKCHSISLLPVPFQPLCHNCEQASWSPVAANALYRTAAITTVLLLMYTKQIWAKNSLSTSATSCSSYTWIDGIRERVSSSKQSRIITEDMYCLSRRSDIRLHTRAKYPFVSSLTRGKR
jgi:hypothetical protein